MSASDPLNSEPFRFALRLPRPLWMLVAAVTLIAAYAGLRIGVPAYQRRIAISEIERFNGDIEYLHRGAPTRPLSWMSEDWMRWLEDPDHVVFWPGEENLKRRSRHGGVRVPTVGPVIDDDKLKCVLGLPNLKSLDLAFSSVSDAGIAHLNALRKLENLRLEGNDVSDESIPILSQMQTLKRLNVEHTQITNAGARALKAALPGCEVRGPHNDPFARLGR